MPIRVAINGFGRIGRCALRAGWHDPNIQFVHINDLTNDDVLAHLLRYDTVHGPSNLDVKQIEGGLEIDGKIVKTSSIREPSELPWDAEKIDVVLECTGMFRSRAGASKHINAGAKKVIISAPATDPDATICVGVNEDTLDIDSHRIVSNASCTTNCLAPLVKVLNDNFGIVGGLITTVHSYTMDQNLLDAPHRKGDFRRARAAALNIVPTSTGAASAVASVIPDLEGKLDGMAIRVPTPNVSIVDLVVELKNSSTVEEVNASFSRAADGHLNGILDAVCAPLVSSDITGNTHSSIVDLELTSSVGSNMFKILSWYDNEWGYSNRLLDLTRLLCGAKT
jgi:glyceraldehyde 3-phosphate dehydrogenase